jgi:hypothetical protein
MRNRFPAPFGRAFRAGLPLLAGLAALSACRPSPPPASTAVTRAAPEIDDRAKWTALPVGDPIANPPWIAHVNVVDLDQDGADDILACECRDNEVVWLRQVAPGRFEEKVVGPDLAAPVHVEAADLDGDGDLDLLVSVMGFVFPNNDRIGEVVILENDGSQNFTPRPIIEKTERVTDVRAADLNGDGRLDLAVAQFGYDQGMVRWLEQTAPWQFRPHDLLDLSGAINIGVADFNGDGHSDLVCLISQQWEEIHLFTNNGSGVFTRKRIWGSTNEDYGSSGISVCDLNRDGQPDVLYTNGDGFGPAALPGPRPWHGVQWLENSGGGNFRYHRVAHLPGAYSPVGVDLNRDGAMDIVAVSSYADWDRKNPDIPSVMAYVNDGQMHFTPHLIARTPKDQIAIAAGALHGPGSLSLVTGGFYVAAPYDRMGRLTLWKETSP